jgi:tetracycline repressor-like protein
MLRQFITTRILGPVVKQLGMGDPKPRITFAASQLLGLGWTATSSASDPSPPPGRRPS